MRMSTHKVVEVSLAVVSFGQAMFFRGNPEIFHICATMPIY